MAEEEQELCLAEPTLEIREETPLQVQVQVMEEMQDMEALEAEEVLEVEVEAATLIIIQVEMEATVELVVMEAAAEVAEKEEAFLGTEIIQEREVQEVLVVLGEEAEAVEMLDHLAAELMVVMVEQEVMAEVEGVVALAIEAALADMAALVALD